METITLRELKSKDVFPMFSIISKIGIDEFKECFESDEVKKMIAGKKADLNAIGMKVMLDVASIIIKNIPRCENEVYHFLAGLSGLTKEEIADLPMNTFFELIVDVAKKEEFKDFIVVVSKLFK
jgi:hypothetical protein